MQPNTLNTPLQLTVVVHPPWHHTVQVSSNQLAALSQSFTDPSFSTCPWVDWWFSGIYSRFRFPLNSLSLSLHGNTYAHCSNNQFLCAKNESPVHFYQLSNHISNCPQDIFTWWSCKNFELNIQTRHMIFLQNIFPPSVLLLSKGHYHPHRCSAKNLSYSWILHLPHYSPHLSLAGHTSKICPKSIFPTTSTLCSSNHHHPSPGLINNPLTCLPASSVDPLQSTL